MKQPDLLRLQRVPRWGVLTALLATFSTACLAPEPARTKESGIGVGLLVSFTGNLAAAGPTIERASLLAAEKLNAAGGVAGEPFRVITRDTQSERRTGLKAATYLFDETDVAGIIGPQNETLAVLLLEQVRANNVAQIFGSVTSTAITEADDNDLWFRTNPSVSSLSRALANRIQADGIQRMALVSVLNEFGVAFTEAMIGELEERNINLPVVSQFNPTERSFRPLATRVVNAEVDGVVLAASPTPAARLIQEWSFVGPPVRWYFAPPLRTPEFVQNVPPGIINGAIGVAPELGSAQQGFARTFADRWFGETPTSEAAFYYDAMAVMGLAMARMHALEGEVSRSGTLPEHIRAVANPPGETVEWDQLARGMEHIEKGNEITYTGVTGSVEFDARGDITDGAAELWTISDNQVRTLE